MIYCEFYPNCTGIYLEICKGKSESDLVEGWRSGDKCLHFKLSKRVRRRILTEFEWMMVQAIYDT